MPRIPALVQDRWQQVLQERSGYEAVERLKVTGNPSVLLMPMPAILPLSYQCYLYHIIRQTSDYMI